MRKGFNDTRYQAEILHHSIMLEAGLLSRYTYGQQHADSCPGKSSMWFITNSLPHKILREQNRLDNFLVHITCRWTIPAPELFAAFSQSGSQDIFLSVRSRDCLNRGVAAWRIRRLKRRCSACIARRASVVPFLTSYRLRPTSQFGLPTKVLFLGLGATNFEGAEGIRWGQCGGRDARTDNVDDRRSML